LRILRVDIEWYEKYPNLNPTFVVEVDKVPDRGELEYELFEYDNLHFLIAEKDGYVSYFTHSRNPEHDDGGFCGQIFEIKVKNVGVVKYVGPWSSRAGMINKIQSMQIVDIIYICGSSRFVGAIELCKLVRDLPHGIAIKKVIDKKGEIKYIPCIGHRRC